MGNNYGGTRRWKLMGLTVVTGEEIDGQCWRALTKPHIPFSAPAAFVDVLSHVSVSKSPTTTPLRRMRQLLDLCNAARRL